MSVLLFLSDAMIPLLIFVIVGYGLLTGCNVYDAFIHGAVRGLKIVVQILPTLIGLMIAVGILRASGFLLWFAGLLPPVCEQSSFPWRPNHAELYGGRILYNVRLFHVRPHPKNQMDIALRPARHAIRYMYERISGTYDVLAPSPSMRAPTLIVRVQVISDIK